MKMKIRKRIRSKSKSKSKIKTRSPIVPQVARERWAKTKMPRPGEDRSNVSGAALFSSIGPVPLSGPRPAFRTKDTINPASPDCDITSMFTLYGVREQLGQD